MRVEGKSTRYYERRNMRLPLEVFYRETDDLEWSESVFTHQVTICGLGFTLSRIVEPNRLIRVRLRMPKSYRLFDLHQENYEVWGVVRYVQLVETFESDKILLNVGASLTGKNPPASFLRDPKTLYDLKPVLKKQSFWEIREMPRKTGPFGRSLEIRRPTAIKTTLETIDETGRKIETFEAETLNVSESGAAVVVSETFAPRKYVLIRKQGETSSLLAAVRGTHRLESNAFRLHLEFMSGKWVA